MQTIFLSSKAREKGRGIHNHNKEHGSVGACGQRNRGLGAHRLSTEVAVAKDATTEKADLTISGDGQKGQ